MFVAKRFESGCGYSIGNSLRRVLWGSIEGGGGDSDFVGKDRGNCARISIGTWDCGGCYGHCAQFKEKVLLRCSSSNTIKLKIDVEREGRVIAGDIAGEVPIEIVNPD
jgi:DNA-directed RNA polymerase subunit alpha